MTMPPVRITCHVIVTDSSSSTLGNGIGIKLSSLSKAHKRNPTIFHKNAFFLVGRVTPYDAGEVSTQHRLTQHRLHTSEAEQGQKVRQQFRAGGAAS